MWASQSPGHGLGGANQKGGLLGLVWNKAVARINNYRALKINAFPYRRIVEVRSACSFLPSFHLFLRFL
jgi:hypothetical protein